MKTMIYNEEFRSASTFPIIQIDYRGRILYANKASFPLLREWNCLANDYLPKQILYKYPALLDLEAAFDVAMETKSNRYQLDVIGFKESGYIGLYGFRTEIKKDETLKQEGVTK